MEFLIRGWEPPFKEVRMSERRLGPRAEPEWECRTAGVCDKELPLTLSIPSIHRCISTLYKNPSWSQEPLQGPIDRAAARVCSSKIGLMFPEQLRYYIREKEIWKSRGQTMSLTDLWGLVIEYFLNQGVREHEMATFAPSQLPFHTFFLPYFFLTPGAEPSKSPV